MRATSRGATHHPFVPSVVEGRVSTSLDKNGTGVAFWAYILKCSDGHYYTGHTDNLEQLYAQHQTGGYCDFTARRRPVELVWSESFSTRIEALEAERRVKPWSRAKKEALMRGDWAALSYLAKPLKERSSTSLGTNGEGGAKPGPFVSSEVETRSNGQKQK